MAVEPVQQLSALDCPDTKLAAGIPTGTPRALRTKGDAPNDAVMAGKGVEYLVVDKIDNNQRIPRASERADLAVAPQIDKIVASRRGDGMEQAAIADTPKPRHPLAAADRQQFATGMILQPLNMTKDRGKGRTAEVGAGEVEVVV